MKRNLQHLIALLLLAGIWGALFYLTQVCTNDPRWYDDRMLYDISTDLENPAHDWVTVFQAYEADWATRRFLPGYSLYRVWLAVLFGTDFVPRFWVNGALGVAASFMFYLFFHRLKVSFLPSILFPCLLLLGITTEPYLRLGYGEPWGVLFLSMLLLLLPPEWRTHSVWRRWALRGGILLCALCMALMKEAFLLFLPSLACVYLYLAYGERPAGSWRNFLKARWFVPVMLLILTVILLFCAKARLHAPDVDVVKASTYQSLALIAKGMVHLASKRDLQLTLLGAGVLLICLWRREQSFARALSTVLAFLVPLLGLCILILLPQAILHAKTGFASGRYWLPGLFGLSFSCIWLYREGERHFPSVFRFFGILLLLFASLMFYKAYDMGARFAASRAQNAHFLSELQEQAPAQSDLLFVVRSQEKGDLEVIMTAQAYLQLQGHFRHIGIAGSDIPHGLYESILRSQKDYRLQRSLRIQPEGIVQRNRLATILIMQERETEFLKRNAGWFHPEEWQTDTLDVPSANWIHLKRYRRKFAPDGGHAPGEGVEEVIKKVTDAHCLETLICIKHQPRSSPCRSGY